MEQIEATVPEDAGLRDSFALLCGTFGGPPHAAHLHCLRIMLKKVDEYPSTAVLTRLLQPMSPDQLTGIAALIRRELP